MINEAILERADEDGADSGAGDARASHRSSRGIVSHVLFPIVMALWAATLFGGIVMALNSDSVRRLSAVTGFEIDPAYEKVAYAACAAVLAAAIAFFIASLARRRALRFIKDPAVVTEAGRRARSLERRAEAEDEGSDDEAEEAVFERSDAIEPLDITSMFEGDEIERAIEEQTEFYDPAPADPAPQLESVSERRDMELEEFGALPGRDGVWVREPLDAEDPPEPVQGEAPADTVGEGEASPTISSSTPDAPEPEDRARLSALEKLRAVPLDELSLIQMVERFAAALSEHRVRTETASVSGHSFGETAGREAALAEALRALSAFSHRGLSHPDAGQRGIQAVDMIGETEQELREALAKLQILRGAA